MHLWKYNLSQTFTNKIADPFKYLLSDQRQMFVDPHHPGAAGAPEMGYGGRRHYLNYAAMMRQQELFIWMYFRVRKTKAKTDLTSILAYVL